MAPANLSPEEQMKLRASVGKNVTPATLDSKLVFVFCGNGLTYHGMCKQLLEKEPVFREKIAEISLCFQSLGSLHILNTLESETESRDFNNPDVIQPLLFAIQVGISTLLKHWGVKPDAVLGHSVGEVAAAHCSGLLSLEDAVKVIYFRSTLQRKVTGGTMLVVSNMPVSEVSSFLLPYAGKVCVAAFNSPQSCTLSGDASAIENVQKELSNSAIGSNLFLRLLDVPTAYHSHMMDPILSDIQKAIGSLHMNELNAELFSTVTGKEVQQGDFCTGKYWKDHESVRSVVSQLFQLGAPVDWNTFYRGYETMPLSFPRYQFDCSHRDVIIGAAQTNTQSDHPVLHQTGSGSNIFTCDLKSESSSYLTEHKHN
uniref:Malonyl-CoA:ACP transacylase (MAT) domain-containing protein n=1 Tax=Salarias fasciatus TaxID=181472 RepID=A0A672FV72_SALFA